MRNRNIVEKGSSTAPEKTKKGSVKYKERTPNMFKRMANKFKDIFSELKKVTWPTFAKVVKQTGVVLVVVIIFLIVIGAFDFGLYKLLNLVTK